MSLKKMYQGVLKICRSRSGFGMNELLGIAAALILAAFVIIPGLKTFAGDVMQGLSKWWDTIVTKTIFPVS